MDTRKEVSLPAMRSNDEPFLTREKILSGQVRKMIRAADPTLYVLSDEELARSRDEILARHDGGDLWVFAYGSLISNPAFHFVERCHARIYGYHRSFCLRTHLGRGSPETPGLMLGLEAGGSCSGLAYRIAAAEVESETWVLWKREMVTMSYAPRWVTTDGAGPARRALTFVMNRAGPLYAGRLSRSEVVETLAVAEGVLGRGCDYLYGIVAEFDALGIHDRSLAEMAGEVRARRRANGSG